MPVGRGILGAMSRVQRRLGTDLLDPETRPWFLWDEDLSVRELRAILVNETHPRWLELAATLMREARDDQVWLFLPLSRVVARHEDIRTRLGRRRAFWDYLLQAWRRPHAVRAGPSWSGLFASVRGLDKCYPLR